MSGSIYQALLYTRDWPDRQPGLFQALLAHQDGECALCDVIFFSKFRDRSAQRPVVDHDHATGLVRGLLCPGCNVALGYFERSKDRARIQCDAAWQNRAADYVEPETPFGAWDHVTIAGALISPGEGVT